MQSIRLVGNYIAEFDSVTNPNRGQGQLQLVLHDRNNLSKEIEVDRPDSSVSPAIWQYNEQLHGGPTPYIGWNDAVENQNRYNQVELNLRPGTTADGTWQLIGQITDSLADQGFAISYDLDDQTENSFVTSVLYVIGIDIGRLSKASYTPIDVTGFAGIETNIINDDVTALFSGLPKVINLDLAGTNRTDYIQGGAGNDILKGALLGLDTIKGGAGNDRITGSYQANRLEAGEGDDWVYGRSGNDTMLGGQGRDNLYGGNGDDVISGGIGDDRVFGNSGDDDLFGSHGNDYISGGAGNDQILGGNGADTAYGGSGNDVFYDGRGSDIYHGDAGGDTFVFYGDTLENRSRDHVRDFNSGTDKLIFDDVKSFTGHSISSGRDADTNGDGRISALDKSWYNAGSDGLILLTEDLAMIRITLIDGGQELQLFDFL